MNKPPAYGCISKEIINQVSEDEIKTFSDKTEGMHCPETCLAKTVVLQRRKIIY